tara:strand:+ start:380 stop:1324 length:945 start_codon:yes stop_codon:yes gene_type:complete
LITRPKILVSKCLEFDACRYDGKLITNKYIRILKDFVDIETVCPEVEIGLGIPRPTIHIQSEKDKLYLYQPSSDIDLTDKMEDFSNNFLKKSNGFDGFIFKSKSPSCGIWTAKRYSKVKNTSPLGTGPGLFAKKIIEKYPFLPKEEDKRLNDVFLREHFYTSIFTIAEFRMIKSFKGLYNFQAKHKLLFMTYNQTKMRIIGKIAANENFKSLKQVLKNYYKNLLEIFSKRPRYLSNINTHMHAFGYYKKFLSKNEKVNFLDLLESYRNKLIPLSTVNSLLYSWNIRFENQYLLGQSYFKPFPRELIEIKESRLK